MCELGIPSVSLAATCEAPNAGQMAPRELRSEQNICRANTGAGRANTGAGRVRLVVPREFKSEQKGCPVHVGEALSRAHAEQPKKFSPPNPAISAGYRTDNVNRLGNDDALPLYAPALKIYARATSQSPTSKKDGPKPKCVNLYQFDHAYGPYENRMKEINPKTSKGVRNVGEVLRRQIIKACLENTRIPPRSG